MGYSPLSKTGHAMATDSRSGVALMIVIAAMAVLSILVTEFTYITQVNQTIAFDALDQVKVHYLAKSALKISLLRLKAFKSVKDMMGAASGAMGGKGGGIPGVPKTLLDKIWNFPFFFPIPVLPGMSQADKDRLEAFQKESGLDGNFSTLITSESGKYNLNMVLSQFVPKGEPSPQPSAAPTTFDPEEARRSLQEYLAQLLNQKNESDVEFAAEYRDYRLDELTDNLVAWMDRTYERKNSGADDVMTIKRAPFYSLAELHMVPLMNDELYTLFAPSLTAATTSGINVNTMSEAVLRALVSDSKPEEITEFFKFRDSEEADNLFKNAEDFFTYLAKNFTRFQGSTNAITQFKEDLTKRHIRIVTDETEFKITVQAKINTAVRQIEAWVSLTEKSAGPGSPGASDPLAGLPAPQLGGGTPQLNPLAESQKDAGIKVNYMRFL